MILLKHHRTTIVTPPKCGSTTLHSLLCSPAHGGIYVIGPQLDGEIDKHTMSLPYESRGTACFVVVRNPFDRAVSLWSHYRAFYAPEITLDDWISNHLRSDPFSEPVSVTMDRAGLACNYWHLEHLGSCLRSVGIRLRSLPVENRGLRTPLTPAQRFAIADWARPDCERFSYPLEPLDA